jgi:hypothetical protein
VYVLLLLLNTTRTRSGPPSTRATITMDGGVAVLLLLLNTTRTRSGPPKWVFSHPRLCKKGTHTKSTETVADLGMAQYVTSQSPQP